MAVQNYVRQGETFRAGGVSNNKIPDVLAGAMERVYKGVQSLLLTTASQTLTVPAGATHADIYAEGDSANAYCRYWQGATAPTSTVGKKLKDHEEIASASPADFRAILSSGVITLRVEYYAYE